MGEREEKFLAGIQSEEAGVRFAAWRRAGEMDPEVMPALAKLLGSDKPGVVKASGEALNTIVHSVGAEPGTPKRAQVVKNLVALLADGQPRPVRVAALRQLSLIGGDEAVAPAARLVSNPELREEAVFCLERIPGKASAAALAKAAKAAGADFKPRLLAALGHRRDEEGVSLSVAAMRSPDKEAALAGLKAYGRIGRKSAVPVRLPEFASLPPWQQIEHLDSRLRYADAQVEQGNLAEATSIYLAALKRDEEHWQCAAIIGLAKVGTAEAAAAIFPKLKSTSGTVRITAEKAWDSLKKSAAKA